MVMAGLATSSHMISATLLSLGKICSVYRGIYTNIFSVCFLLCRALLFTVAKIKNSIIKPPMTVIIAYIRISCISDPFWNDMDITFLCRLNCKTGWQSSVYFSPFAIFSEFLPPDVVKRLLLSSVQLLRSKDREVMKSALAFAKVCHKLVSFYLHDI